MVAVQRDVFDGRGVGFDAGGEDGGVGGPGLRADKGERLRGDGGEGEEDGEGDGRSAFHGGQWVSGLRVAWLWKLVGAAEIW